jgi:hypothetical protein
VYGTQVGDLGYVELLLGDIAVLEVVQDAQRFLDGEGDRIGEWC